MKIIVFAAHPDDAETIVAGSICSYIKQGHSVHIVNMTGAGGARVQCASDTAKLYGATCEFLPFKDAGEVAEENAPLHLGVQFDSKHLDVIYKVIQAQKPDMVWTHWPVDTHPDHVATGALTARATDLLRLEGEIIPDLWYYGPCIGYQALCFKPDHFVDVTDFIDIKQQGIDIYNKIVPIAESYKMEITVMKHNGFQAGCHYAEGFVRSNFRIGDARYKVLV